MKTNTMIQFISKIFLENLCFYFFDDILIYNKSWKDHVQHVDRVLKLLEEKQLYAKPSKCLFEVSRGGIFGSYCIHEGVKVDLNKIKAIKEWKIPTTLKHL